MKSGTESKKKQDRKKQDEVKRERIKEEKQEVRQAFVSGVKSWRRAKGKQVLEYKVVLQNHPDAEEGEAVERWVTNDVANLDELLVFFMESKKKEATIAEVSGSNILELKKKSLGKLVVLVLCLFAVVIVVACAVFFLLLT